MEINNFKEMDPLMLYSIINLKLRDFYGSIDSLCEDNNIERKQLEETLGKAGFEYNEDLNQFK